MSIFGSVWLVSGLGVFCGYLLVLIYGWLYESKDWNFCWLPLAGCGAGLDVDRREQAFFRALPPDVEYISGLNLAMVGGGRGVEQTFLGRVVIYKGKCLSIWGRMLSPGFRLAIFFGYLAASCLVCVVAQLILPRSVGWFVLFGIVGGVGLFGYCQWKQHGFVRKAIRSFRRVKQFSFEDYHIDLSYDEREGKLVYRVAARVGIHKPDKEIFVAHGEDMRACG